MSENSLTIERMLNATPQQVWWACSNANVLRYWWAQPEGAVMPTIELDFRIGGSLFFRVELAGGEVIWGKCFYKDIVPLKKIVVDNHFSNEKGELLDSPEWPPSTITLTIEDTPGGTKLTVRHEGIGAGAHKVERYKEGWAQSLERLALELVNQ